MAGKCLFRVFGLLLLVTLIPGRVLNLVLAALVAHILGYVRLDSRLRAWGSVWHDLNTEKVRVPILFLFLIIAH